MRLDTEQGQGYLHNGFITWLSNGESSAIDHFIYWSETQTLTVAYTNGGMYEYREVPFSLVNTLLFADSVGSFLAKNIKGSHDFQRVA